MLFFHFRIYILKGLLIYFHVTRSSSIDIKVLSYIQHPNSVDLLHPDFFEFTGRVVTLVLMQKVQSGGATQVVFSSYSWTERKLVYKISEDTDRIMYNSCKQILEMNPVSIDSYAGLGLAFVSETEVLGERETEERYLKMKSPLPLTTRAGNNMSVS